MVLTSNAPDEPKNSSLPGTDPEIVSCSRITNFVKLTGPGDETGLTVAGKVVDPAPAGDNPETKEAHTNGISVQRGPDRVGNFVKYG